MKKIITTFIFFLSLPLATYAGTLTISPNTGTARSDIIIQSCTGCVDGSGYSVSYLYDGSGNWTGAGNFQVDLSLLPTAFTNTAQWDANPVGVTYSSLDPLPVGTYTLMLTGYDSDAAQVAACETSLAACISYFRTDKEYASFTITSGGGGGSPPVTGSTVQLTNNYIFLMTSMGVYLLQLMAILAIFYIASVIVLWPTKGLWRKMKRLIKRGEYPS